MVFDWPAGALSYVEQAALHWTIQLRNGPGRVVPVSATAEGSLALAGDLAVSQFRDALSSARERMLRLLTATTTPDAVAVRLLGDGLYGLPSPLLSRARVELGWFVGTRSYIESSQRVAASHCELILAGSVWAQQLLRANGIDGVELLPSAVDTTVFRPRARETSRDDQFVIYSGGALCYRKGQDIVLAAVKAFRSLHPETVLVTSWQNPLTELSTDIIGGDHVSTAPRVLGTSLQIGEWAAREGLVAGSVVDVGYVPPSILAHVLSEVDVALFPSRAESDSNPDALQTLACGIPTVLSQNSGHLDLTAEPWVWSLNEQRAAKPSTQGYDGWGESSVDEIVSVLESIYHDRRAARERAAAAVPRMAERDWRASARLLASYALRAVRSSNAPQALAS